MQKSSTVSTLVDWDPSLDDCGLAVLLVFAF
jgi:hypothetical protein